MKTLPCLVAALVLGASFVGTVAANTSIRGWAKADGERFRAQIVSWDAETDEVTLSKGDEKTFKMARTDLSLSDQAYVKHWFDQNAKLQAKLTEIGGELEHFQTTGEYPTDAYVYRPSGYQADGSAPMMILFSSSGQGQFIMLRHFEAAEKAGIALVTLDVFKNGRDWGADLKRFNEVLPQLETRVAHNPAKLYLGGDSGGALRAFRYTADVARPWAGVYSNGGWLGDDYTMKCYKGMRVAIVNGHKDHANGRIKPDSEYLANKRDCFIGVFSFEGGHQYATVEAQVESFKWLLGDSPE